MLGIKLENLNEMIQSCRQNYENLEYKGDVYISDELKNNLEKYMKGGNDPEVNILDYSIEIVTRDGSKAQIPSTWLWVVYTFYSLAESLENYKSTFNKIKDLFKEKNNLNDKSAKDFFKLFPLNLENHGKDPIDSEDARKAFEVKLDAVKPAQSDAQKNILNLQFESLDDTVREYFGEDSVSVENFNHFLYDRDWWFRGNGKTLDRSDYCESSFLLAAQMLVANSAKLYPLTLLFAEHKELINAFEYCIENNRLEPVKSWKSSVSLATHALAGENIIFYGAPGTGKSFAIDQKTGPHNSIRTVFHPETQYSDFVGCIKPSMGDDGIEYSFRKGPFTEVLIRAMNDPEQHYYLIIEEINRAPAAAVFGELFQLLDRNADGRSSYTIDINDKDLLQIFNTELSGKFPDNKLFIPSNLSIYATMNSSDQAVMPLDTAFKRRWKFNYIPINFSNSPEGSFEIIAMDKEHRISWSDFAQSVNRILSAEAIPEDRHLGPWFVTAEEIASSESSDKTLTGKVLMYLWDDVLRHTERTVLFHPDIRTFGSLVEHYSRKAVIFSDRFQNQLQEKLIAVLPGETEGITGE